MNKTLLATMLVLGGLFAAAPASAEHTYRSDIRTIEQEYARTHNGRMISDAQLVYYVDRLDSGWSMDQIRRDMQATSTWTPQRDWVAREVICSSNKGRYRECRIPFRGKARITEQLSDSACVRGRSWGEKPGAIWVSRGCRARFGVVGGRRYGERDGDRGWVRDTNYAVNCDSVDGRRTVCTWDNRYGTPRMVQQISSSACIEGRDWGYDVNGGLWVNSGCRARFGYAPSSTDPSNGWVRDNNYAVECSSADGRRAMCTWDTRYGTPRLIQQISSSACVEGRDWGYDSRGNLWVDAGCRARFGFR